MKNPSEWIEQASCKGLDTNIWFPAEPQGKDYFAYARTICDNCKVQNECLEYALSFPAVDDIAGMYGGKSPWQRDMIRKNRTEINRNVIKYSYGRTSAAAQWRRATGQSSI